jgi:DNA-binding transcriptional LysR family regulator
MVLDIRQLQHVAAIGRFRSFARAAESLRISQPALSKSLKVIERSLEVRLFERGRSGVTPTAFGELLLARAGPLFRGLDEALAEVRQLRGLDSGSLAVGAGPFPFELSVASAISTVARRHPGLMLRVVQGDWDSLTREVLAGSLDLAIAEVSDAEQEPRLSVERLGAHRGVFYCRADHPLLAVEAPSFEDLAGFPLVMNRLPGRVAHFFERHATAGRVDPLTGHFLPAFMVSSVALMQRIVAETNAVSWAPRSLIEAGLRAGTLHALPTAPAWAQLSYAIIRRADRPATPALEAFLAEVRAIEAGIPPGFDRPPPRRRRVPRR